MTDIFDRAQDSEEFFRQDAVAAAREQMAEEGFETCLSCGHEIDQVRRRVMPSAKRCVACQAAAERWAYLRGGA